MDQELDGDRGWLLEEAVFRTDDPGPGRVGLEDQLRAFSASFVERLRRGVLGEVLVSAVGPEHVGSTHAANASVVAVVRGARRVVGGKVVEGRGDSRRVQVIPERSTLTPEHGRRRLVIERPEVEREPVVPHLPGPLAGYGLGGGVKRGALLLRVAVDEVKNPVRSRPRAVDEVGPCDRTLRRRAGAQASESTACSQFFQVGQQAGLHHAFRKAGIHAVDADHDHFLPEAARDAAATAQPIVTYAQPGGARGGDGGRASEQSSASHLGDGSASHQTTSARVSARFLGAFTPASRTTSALPSM